MDVSRIFCFFLLMLLFSACEQNTYQIGERLYKKNCANCHMDNGEGLGALIPPLAGSDFLESRRNQLPCIVRYGLQDTIVVNGKTYGEQMIGNPALQEIQITNVLNYICQRWGNKHAPFTFDEIQAALGKCAQKH